MRLATVARILLGITFIVGGGVKTKRFGKQFAPESYRDMAKLFNKSYKMFPIKETFHVTASQYQEIAGYTDIICGFMLISGQLVFISSLILMLQMLKVTYVLHKQDYPPQYLAAPILIFFALLSVSSFSGRKEKQD